MFRLGPVALAVLLLAAVLSACSSGTTVTPPGPAPVPVAQEAAVPRDLEEACATDIPDCRGPGSVRLRTENGDEVEASWDLNVPPVEDGRLVSIFPGETLYLESRVADGRFLGLRSVPTVTDPDRTITVEFGQKPDDVAMTLVVRNPFNRPVKYRAGMLTLDSEEVLSTSSCPVVPGGSSHELWPFPILQIYMADFRFLADTDPTTCE